MGVAYSAHTIYTRSRERVKIERHVSCVIRSPNTVINTHDRFAVALSAPGVGVIGHVPREFSRVVRHFCSTEGCLLGRRQRGKGLEVPCLYTCPRCAAVDRSRYRAIFFDQKCMCLTSSTKDRKKGCACDPDVLMIQDALQNQTLQYTCTHVRACTCKWHFFSLGLFLC